MDGAAAGAGLAHQSTRNYVCKFEVCTYNVDGSIKADIYVNSP